MSIYILNTPILTDWGRYDFEKAPLSTVKIILRADGFISAVGHEGTASFMSRITGVNIPFNRMQVRMQTGDLAIVFRVLTRLPEGKILTDEELSHVPYEFGLLRKVY